MDSYNSRKKPAIILAEIIVKRYFIIAYYSFDKLNELKVKKNNNNNEQLSKLFPFQASLNNYPLIALRIS